MYIIDNNITKVIEKLSHDVFIVRQNFNVRCPCVDFTTSQANPSHDKCLGTGYQIKRSKIRAAGQVSSVSFSVSGSGEAVSTDSFYIKNEYQVCQDNIIVDGDSANIVQKVSELKTNERKPVYRKCTTVPKKSNAALFISNFNKIVGRS